MSSFIVTMRMMLAVLCVFFLFAISSSISSPVPQQQGIKGNGRRINNTPFDGFGDTNIPCNKPGSFTQAPDGCNRCYCARDGKFSSACSRVFCPSSQGLFPSYGAGHRISSIKF